MSDVRPSYNTMKTLPPALYNDFLLDLEPKSRSSNQLQAQ